MTHDLSERFQNLVLNFMRKHGDVVDHDMISDFMEELTVSKRVGPPLPPPSGASTAVLPGSGKAPAVEVKPKYGLSNLTAGEESAH